MSFSASDALIRGFNSGLTHARAHTLREAGLTHTKNTNRRTGRADLRPFTVPA